jgi:hypothetical protein
MPQCLDLFDEIGLWGCFSLHISTEQPGSTDIPAFELMKVKDREE